MLKHEHAFLFWQHSDGDNLSRCMRKGCADAHRSPRISITRVALTATAVAKSTPDEILLL
jgi:hypothetical protein